MLPYLVLIAGWLLFPKSFALFVGAWFGAITGGFFWSLLTFAMAMLVGWNALELTIMGASFIVFVSAGSIGGVILAARG